MRAVNDGRQLSCVRLRAAHLPSVSDKYVTLYGDNLLLVKWKAADSSKLCQATEEPQCYYSGICFVVQFGRIPRPSVQR